MQEHGKVIEVEKDTAVVRVKRHSACGHCKACAIGRSGEEYIDLRMENTIQCAVGDEVTLELEDPEVLKAAIIVYMIPLSALLAGFIASYLVLNQIGAYAEWKVVLVSLVCLVLSYFIVRKMDKKFGQEHEKQPKLTGYHS